MRATIQPARPAPGGSPLWALGRVCALGLLLLTSAPWSNAAEPSPELSIKAAYLYNFARFAEWPTAAFSAADAPVIIGVLSDDSGTPALIRDALKGKRAGKRPIVVREIKNEPASVTTCHVLYLVDGKTLAPPALEALRRAPVMVVTDNGDTAAVHFRSVDDAVRFELDLGAAEQAGIRLSARLASVAWRIRRNE